MIKYNSRKEVPNEYKWDLTDFFKDDNDFEESMKKAKEMVLSLKSYVGCTKDSNRMLEFLECYMNTIELIERLYVYAYLINDQELGNSKSLDRKNKTSDLMKEYNINTSFFEPELLKLSKKNYEKLFKDNSLLCEYRKMLDDIYRNKDHILDEKEENIINELVNSMNDFEEMSSTMLNFEHDYGEVIIDGEKEKITSTNYRRLMKNENRSIRKEIRKKFYRVLEKYSTSSAQFLNSFVKGSISVARLHNFKDAWDQKLFGLKMTDKAYNALISVVEKNVSSLQRYFRIYKKHFDFDKLYQYDLNLELTKEKKEYSIEDAQELCLKAVAPLGDDYVRHFKKIIDNHYIDYAQYPSKCSGAYSFSTINKDSRVLMSFNYDLDSVSTMIHEGGHNVHHQYVNENNPLQYRLVGTLVSEVASLTNECLLSSYLSENGSNLDEKIAGISNIIDVIISNLFGAVREGKIETDFYKHALNGNSITKDYMDELDRKSLDKYYGDTINYDEYSSCSWIRRSHFYMNYYLYNYAFCISVASNIAMEILNGNKEMLDNYIKFLKTGNDVEPIDVFKIIGVDLESKTVYENAIKYFESMLDKLEALL